MKGKRACGRRQEGERGMEGGAEYLEMSSYVAYRRVAY